MNTTTKVFGKSLGATGHHENCRIAFKWEDATHKTKFLGVRIRPTRSGILSLTALFTPVMIDGSKVQKATLHNVDIFRKLQLGIGDELEVYKANMIIQLWPRTTPSLVPTSCLTPAPAAAVRP